MKTAHVLVALSTLVPALAWSAPVHSIWSTAAVGLTVPGSSTTIQSATGTASWTESSSYANINVRVTTSGGVWDFQLVSVTGLTSNYQVNGLWNVSLNGTPQCTNCTGQAYGFTSPTGSYYKIYVSNSTYGVAASISSRYDY
jgi:hypothetical protein